MIAYYQKIYGDDPEVIIASLRIKISHMLHDIEEIQATIQELESGLPPIDLSNEVIVLLTDFMKRNGITRRLLLTRLNDVAYADERKWTQAELDKIFSGEIAIKSPRPFTYGTSYEDHIKRQLGIFQILRDANNKLTYRLILQQ